MGKAEHLSNASSDNGEKIRRGDKDKQMGIRQSIRDGDAERDVKIKTGCTKKAEWALHEVDPYMDTYSCTDHLSLMVVVEIEQIEKYAGDEICCFISHIPKLGDS